MKLPLIRCTHCKQLWQAPIGTHWSTFVCNRCQPWHTAVRWRQFIHDHALHLLWTIIGIAALDLMAIGFVLATIGR